MLYPSHFVTTVLELPFENNFLSTQFKLTRLSSYAKHEEFSSLFWSENAAWITCVYKKIPSNCNANEANIAR